MSLEYCCKNCDRSEEWKDIPETLGYFSLNIYLVAKGVHWK